MEPIVHGLETEFEADVAFEQIDASTERGQAAIKAYSLRGHPSYVLFTVATHSINLRRSDTISSTHSSGVKCPAPL